LVQKQVYFGVREISQLYNLAVKMADVIFKAYGKH